MTKYYFSTESRQWEPCEPQWKGCIEGPEIALSLFPNAPVREETQVGFTHANCTWDGQGIHWVQAGIGANDWTSCKPIEKVKGSSVIRDCIPTTLERAAYTSKEISGVNYMPEKVDTVNHPPHYNQPGKLETIEVMKNSLSTEEFHGYLKGQVLKYLARANYKHATPLEDTKKAQWYLNRLVQELEGE